MTPSSKIKRAILTTLALLGVVGIAAFSWVWFAPCALGGCAPVDELAEYQAEGSQLLDVNGDPFATLATVNRRLVSLDSLPDHLTQAFVAIEDRRFYDHSGIDLQRVVGAFLSNVRAGGVAEGGSTITMQLARNLFPEWLPYTERSVRRKVMEARVARQIERELSKGKILELYLNHIYLGAGAYGVEAAAQAYFGKPAAEVTLEEAAMLAGLPQAPSRLDPTENPEGARQRRDLVLLRMAEVGYITPAQAEEARERPLQLTQASVEAEDAQGSYFVERVRREMEELVGSRFYTAGLSIETTFDPVAQRAAEEELARQLDGIEAGRFGTYRHATYPEAKGEVASGRTTYLQGAVVVMDARDGAVRALVGGRDFEDSKFDRATQAMRQPGSAFKPFVYLAALERYGSPAQQFEDAPVRLTLAGGQVWEPENYTGRYEGPMTLREALTRSKNSVTVRVAQDVGMRSVREAARDLGITTDIPEVPSAALGAVEVRPLELVSAYAPLANGGRRVAPHFIKRVVTRHGEVVWEASPETERVVDPAVAFVLTTILQDVVSRGTGTAVRAVGFHGPAAGKTGTTNDATDVWFVGYTPELVAGVWIGMDEPQTIVRGASGGTLAAPVWGRVMSRIYDDRPAAPAWEAPAGVVTAEVERVTGLVVDEFCPAQGPTYTEYFVRSAPPRRFCTPTTYTTYGPADTLWMDEEWSGELDVEPGAGGDPGSTDWPELEALRRRIRLGENPASLPSPSLTPGAEAAGPEPGSAASADGDADPPPERPAPEPADDGPELLGVPVGEAPGAPSGAGGGPGL